MLWKQKEIQLVTLKALISSGFSISVFTLYNVWKTKCDKVNNVNNVMVLYHITLVQFKKNMLHTNRIFAGIHTTGDM